MVRKDSFFRHTNLRNRRPGSVSMRGRSGQVEDEAYWRRLKRLAAKQGRSVKDPRGEILRLGKLLRELTSLGR